MCISVNHVILGKTVMTKLTDFYSRPTLSFVTLKTATKVSLSRRTGSSAEIAEVFLLTPNEENDLFTHMTCNLDECYIFFLNSIHCKIRKDFVRAHFFSHKILFFGMYK